jgi:class 3 adenylate cyclase
MTAAALPEAALAERAERRQLTIMFCDLVDSVGLSTRLDPEDLRDVIAAYHRACAHSIDLYNGYVARYLGDGVLIYFGYPEAHEDDAERGVRTALDLVQVGDEQMGAFKETGTVTAKPQTSRRGYRHWPDRTVSSSRR